MNLGYFDLLAPIYNIIFKPKSPRRFLEFVKSIDLPKNSRFIEIGGGNGRMAQYFVPYFSQTWVFDPSIPMLKEAKGINSHLRLAHGYANNLPFPDSSFDFIFIYDSFHHWHNQAESLVEMNRVLKKRGYLIIVEIHPQHKAGHLIASMESILKMGSSFYSPDELQKEFENSGYIIQRKKWLKPPSYYLLAQKP